MATIQTVADVGPCVGDEWRPTDGEPAGRTVAGNHRCPRERTRHSYIVA